MYVLTTHKSQETYEEIFRNLLEIEPNINPTDIMTDFEMAAIKAAKNHFPMAALHGCFFHFTQSFWRHVQTCGLQSIYAKDEDFAFNIRMVLSLAFVPLEHVVPAYEELMKTPFFAEDKDGEFTDQIQTLMTYFQSTYMYGFDRSGNKKASLYPPEIWNVYETTLLGNEVNLN